jgi:hypothetical protein
MISLSLFESIFGLLDGLDAERYGYNFECEYENVMRALNTKMQKLEFRNTYSRIVFDADEDARVGTRFPISAAEKAFG